MSRRKRGNCASIGWRKRYTTEDGRAEGGEKMMGEEEEDRREGRHREGRGIGKRRKRRKREGEEDGGTDRVLQDDAFEFGVLERCRRQVRPCDPRAKQDLSTEHRAHRKAQSRVALQGNSLTDQADATLELALGQVGPLEPPCLTSAPEVAYHADRQLADLRIGTAEILLRVIAATHVSLGAEQPLSVPGTASKMQERVKGSQPLRSR
eukprot:3039411-Rhodomonas_salina.1